MLSGSINTALRDPNGRMKSTGGLGGKKILRAPDEWENFISNSNTRSMSSTYSVSYSPIGKKGKYICEANDSSVLRFRF